MGGWEEVGCGVGLHVLVLGRQAGGQRVQTHHAGLNTALTKDPTVEGRTSSKDDIKNCTG